MSAKEELIKLLNGFGGHYSKYDIFVDWVTLMALSITNSTDLVHNDTWKQREKRCLDIVNRHSKEEFETLQKMFFLLTVALDENIEDVLGEVYMKSECGNKTTGQFFTPVHIQELLAQMKLEDMKEQIATNGTILMNEPSCGGGGMILATAKVLKDNGINYQKVLKVTANDLDWKAIFMTYVQLSLIGIDGVVIQGDTLKCAPPTADCIFETPVRKGLIL